ncbi:MAG TPA: SAM-dependent methyltransferase [Chthoniobacteraceae bacterium]|nr:SAM-dependent methyltransferase [Chthoniobacteraceae bacterium]
MSSTPSLKGRDRFLADLAARFETGRWVRLTLGHPATAEQSLRKVLARPVLIRGETLCSLVHRHATRDETRNLPFPEAVATIAQLLGETFLSAHLFTQEAEITLTLGKKERLRTVAAKHAAPVLEHDRAKARPLDASAPFLKALGVTDAQGKVRERMRDKFRQIQRFVDLLGSAYRESVLARDGDRPLHLCDMGSGKGYLTFAAYDYFERIAHRVAHVTGVEQRAELANFCQETARQLGARRLTFLPGAIESFPAERIDLLIALHACDTTTDEAIAAGVKGGAAIVLAAPCCHKEARPQVDAAADRDGPLSDLLRYGLFAERHAEMATDALRALLLEAFGYKVRVAEFVAAEHTAKNVLLIATRRKDAAPDAMADPAILARVERLKAFYGIRRLRLESLLGIAPEKTSDG